MTDGIIAALREIQDRHGYLPASELESLSRRIKVPLYELHGVATFFPHFRLAPPPQVALLVCQDLPCQMRGADALARMLAAKGAALGGGRVEVKPCSCLGQCDRAPALSVNDAVHAGVTAIDAEALVESALGGHVPHQSRPDRLAVPLRADPYPADQRYGVTRAFVAHPDTARVLAELKDSGLVGMGGAGFPTATKWELVKNAPGDVKFVVCNADESEVGTIKDREIMRVAPHLVIEGMLLAGLVTGAQQGYLYIRHEYHDETAILQREIGACYAAGLLGGSVLGSGRRFDLEIFVSPGGYICGEETALLEAMEGKRAQPRNKPPFPVFAGLWQKPTCLNNVETFAFVPLVLARGAAHFKSLGVNGGNGLKFIGISGDVVRPGVFEIPMGLTVRDAIDGLAGGVAHGRQLKAFAPSGASSGFLPASKADTPLSFAGMREQGTMLGSGALVVLDDTRSIVEAALNAVRFFRVESCGKCVPCRIGSQKLEEMLGAWLAGRGRLEDLDLLQQLAVTLEKTSICGLGQVVPAPIASAVRHFPQEVRATIERGRAAGAPR